MNDILAQIVADKQKEVAARKQLFPQSYWEQSPMYTRAVVSLKKALLAPGPQVIAEHKRRSPSKAVINQKVQVPEVVQGYAAAGVAALSVLTEGPYFGGSLDDLVYARYSCDLPILRKDFVVDPYQIAEARAHGADAILLIAAILSRSTIEQLSTYAQDLGLEVLLEVHNAEELEKSLMPSLDCVGVNNRNLKTFDVSLKTSYDLKAQIPADVVAISESGLQDPDDVRQLHQAGFDAFLMGERFMKEQHPGKAAAEFLQKLNP